VGTVAAVFDMQVTNSMNRCQSPTYRPSREGAKEKGRLWGDSWKLDRGSSVGRKCRDTRPVDGMEELRQTRATSTLLGSSEIVVGEVEYKMQA